MTGKKTWIAFLKKPLVLAGLGALVFVLAGLFFWQVFASPAKSPVDTVKAHIVPGTGVDVADRIQPYLTEQGEDIVQKGFKPTWGAEQVSPGEYTVVFAYEVGRESRWISWKVLWPSGTVTPLDDWARQLWDCE